MKEFRDSLFCAGTKVPFRYDTLEGKQHLVFPAILIKESVLNGALVPKEEFGKYINAWNGIPLPVRHPTQEGKEVSANSPKVIDECVIGRVFNAKLKDDKLTAEFWIDESKALKLGLDRLIDNLKNGNTIQEVSTGYYSDYEPVKGVFNGNEYDKIHRNIRPDHVAILVDEVGACSVKDGCGVPRINRRINMKLKEAMTLITNALGIGEGKQMDLMKEAKEIQAHGGITAKQLKVLEDMDADSLALFKALVEAMLAKNENKNDEEEEEEEEQDMADVTDLGKNKDDDKPDNNKDKSGGACLTTNQVKELIMEMIEQKLPETITRKAIIEDIVSNSDDGFPFNKDELSSLTDEQLNKLKTFSTRSFFGRNNCSSDNRDATPLMINRGIFSSTQNKEDK